MDTRKMYVRPAVESDEILEQTSLACTLAMWPDEIDTGNKTICGPALTDPGCFFGLLKGGAWDQSFGCSGSTPYYDETCTVQFS